MNQLSGILAGFLLLSFAVRHRAKFQRKQDYVQVLSISLTRSVVRIGKSHYTLDLTLPPTTIEPLFSGAAWAGTVIWPTSVFLANYLRHNETCEGKVVIELGSGVGLPGITSGLLGASKVILTEQPPLDELLERNVLKIGGHSTVYEVFNLDWRKEPPKETTQVDLILISDCIYEGLYGDGWKNLAKIMAQLLGPSNKALNCVERRNSDGVDKFIEFCQKVYNVKSHRILRLESIDRILELYEHRR